MSNKKNELSFKYIYTYDYNPVYVNGAHGGVSPRGEVVINFYLERQPLPDTITHEITPAGTIGREVDLEPKNLNNSMVRFISNGVVMSQQTAREVHYWLGEKIKEMEAIEDAKLAMQGEQGAGKPSVTH
jgi:hypothetical protein